MSGVFLGVLVSLLIASAASSREAVHLEDVIDATVTIMNECLAEEAEQTLLLGGDYNDFLRRAFFNIKAVALIAESKYNALERYTMTRYSYHQYLSYHFVHFLRKVHRFVMTASSQPMLRSILQRTKDSPWANAEGFYILVDMQTEKRGCINARSYLWAAWEYDLLYVLFLCIDPEDGIVYYTYNPYSKDVPENWVEVGEVKGRMGHPWTIFKKKYVNDSHLCADLEFDRTSNLNGYMIRLNAIQMQPYLKINMSEKGLNRYSGENGEIIKILFHKLRASLNIFIHNGTSYELGDIGPNGTLRGMLTPVSDGRLDIGMNTRSLYFMWKIKYTYPHAKTGLCVISQPSQQVSEFTKLITFLEPIVLAGVIVVCLLTYAVLTRSEGYVPAALDLIRLMVCGAILHPPRTSSSRIFLCMVLILFLNVNSLFQGRWASLLTSPVYYNDVNGVENLKRTGYNIYGPLVLRDFLSDEVLKSRYVVTTSHRKCINQVRNDKNTVCIGDCYHVYFNIKNLDLYVSDSLREMMLTFVTREDWPLFQRVNDAIMYMVQCGLINKFREDSLRDLRVELLKKNKGRKGYKVMLLSQLAFSFCILGIGYTCAAVVFAIELAIGRFGRGRREVAKRRGEERRAEKNVKVIVTPAWD